MEVYAYFEKKNLPSLIQALQELNSCNAITIGESEKPKKADVSLKEYAVVKSYISAHTEGFFLHSSSGLYSVSLQDNTFSTICFFSNEALNDDSILEILSAYAKANAEFGYAAEEEYEYRNRIKVDVSGNGGGVESWVGRDLTKHLPGLYYYTLISRNQINEKSINSEALKATAVSTLDLYEHAILFKFFDSSDSWHSEKDRIDDICRSINNVFCKDDVETEAHKAKNVMELLTILREWG